MNWTYLRSFPWLDTRARFVSGIPRGGAVLDLGSSDGETLRHFAELRPDLRFFAADVEAQPANYPPGCQFQKADFEREKLPWPNASMDAVTCMHVIEHLKNLDLLLAETTRVLKPGGRVYFETPHPKTLVLSSAPGAAAGTFCMNFFDFDGHIRPVTMGSLATRLRELKLEILDSGTSRNWLFAAAHPLFMFLPASRKKFTARAHWIGWSAYLIARRT